MIVKSEDPVGFVALLRGINVGGHNKIPMAELRDLCSEIGLAEVRTYIQSGNVVFASAAAPADVESTMERAILERFGLSIPIIIRSAREWATYIGDNPFLDDVEREPKLVMLALGKRPPALDAVSRLSERAANGERVVQCGGALWIHFPEGSGLSKLTPGLLDRVVGSPVTTRNWLTVLKLGELLGVEGARE
jgi:uncharacterized protein (DUF1697 family)